MYRYYNANSHNNFINDCVIRMTAVIEDIPYSRAYMHLSKLAMQEGLMLDDSRFVRRLLDKKYKRIPYKEKTIGEFAENHRWFCRGYMGFNKTPNRVCMES